MNTSKEPDRATRLPCVPNTAPFTLEQRAWLNGYLAGLFADATTDALPGAAARPDIPAKKAKSLLVMFGSQTGTAEQLARSFATQAATREFAPRVMELNAFAGIDLSKETRLVIVSSTWGDGDPPENAAAFWQLLNSLAAPRLDHLSFAVLGLGDRNYSDFCGAAKKFDERLEQLGASRLVPRAECDVDYEATARAWIEGLWPALDTAGPASRLPNAPGSDRSLEVPNAENTGSSAVEAGGMSAITYNRAHPFPARLITNRKLNGAGSAKETRHIEISLEGSGLNYEVGDALGILPTNCPVLIEELLATLGFKGEEIVRDPAGHPITLHEALLRHYSITQPTAPLLQTAAERGRNAELLALLAPQRKDELGRWLVGRDIVDVIRTCSPAEFTAQEFVGFLRKLQPRLYSISSSPKAHPGEVHLTVAAVRYEAHGRARKGVGSCFLADRVTAHDTSIPVFIQTSQGFRLPPDGQTPVIMIGPGTGVAPFRAFLEERRAVGAKGKNWLFFGDQCFSCDFLYRDELEAMRADGRLTRLDTAFSRDQKEKFYVQHRMLENAEHFWEWLETGAHVYVCGDAKRMAKDVDAALHEVIVNAGGKSKDQAAEYVIRLKSEKRYQRDVY